MITKHHIIKIITKILPKTKTGEPHWIVDYVSYNGEPRPEWTDAWLQIIGGYSLIIFVTGHYICKHFGFDVPIFAPHF